MKRFLQIQGWALAGTGSRGEMWGKDRFRVAIPNNWASDFALARETVARLANATDTDPGSLWLRLINDGFDLIKMQIEGQSLRPGYIQLGEASAAVSSAKRLISCAGTSAVRPTRRIDGKYDRRAQRVAREALLGHTKDGSFIFPIYVQVRSVDTRDELFSDELFEAFPRRTTRALSDSLTMARRLVDQTGESIERDLDDAVAAGVSSELCSSLAKMLQGQDIEHLKIAFEWGLSPGPAPEGTTTIAFDKAAQSVLKSLARRLATPAPDREMNYVGRLITIGRDPDEREHFIVIHTYRNGRPTELRVLVGEEVHSKAVRWYEEKATIIARGIVQDVQSQAIIREPLSVKAIVESQLS